MTLFDLLVVSNGTLFYAHAVVRGSWWLPALRRGHRCFGSYAIPPSQLALALEEAIDEIRRAGDMNEGALGTAVASDWPSFAAGGRTTAHP